MAATAAYKGKVRANISGGGFSDLAGVNDVSISLSKNLVDVSTMNASDDFIKRLATLSDFPISISGFFEPLDTAYGHFKNAFVNPALPVICQVYFDGSKAAGSQGFQVTVLVESIDISASVDGAQEVSISLQSNSNVSFL